MSRTPFLVKLPDQIPWIDANDVATEQMASELVIRPMVQRDRQLFDPEMPHVSMTNLLAATTVEVVGVGRTKEEHLKQLRTWYWRINSPLREWLFYRMLQGTDPGGKVTIAIVCPHDGCGREVDLPAVLDIPEEIGPQEHELALSLEDPIEFNAGKTLHVVKTLRIRLETGEDLSQVWPQRKKEGEAKANLALWTRRVLEADGCPITTTLVGNLSWVDADRWARWDVEQQIVKPYQQAPCPECRKPITYPRMAYSFFVRV